MVVRHRAWHDIITLGHDTRSDYGESGMTLSPLSSTQGRDMSGVECHYHYWNEHMVERRQVWYAIITFRQHSWLDDVRRGMQSYTLDNTCG